MAPESEPVSTPIQTRHAQWIATSLEDIRTQRADVAEQLAELNQRLRQLELDEEYLTGLQAGGQAAEVAATTDAQEASPPPVSVPAPRQAAPGKAPAKKTAAKAAKKTPADTAPQAAKKPAAKKAPAKKTAGNKTPGAGRAGQPTWATLVLEVLAGHGGEPRLVKEVREELEAKHPERSASAQTVRNALETLVTQGAADKHSQNKTVMYSARRDPEAAGAPSAPVGESEPASV